MASNVERKMFSFDDVIMYLICIGGRFQEGQFLDVYLLSFPANIIQLMAHHFHAYVDQLHNKNKFHR